MSFRIFAAGVPNFHFERDNNPDDDVFEVAEVLNAIRASGPSVGEAANAAAEYVTPNSYLGAISALARIEFLHLLKTSVDLLALRPKARQGWIAVAPREDHLLWPDTAGFAKYTFNPGSDPGTEFFNKIKGPLKETGMNNYGVLRMLAMVLSMYNNHISNSDPVMIQIQLFN